VTLLRELGTVAFDADLMLSLIGLGEFVEAPDGSIYLDRSRKGRGVMQFGAWLAILPERYRTFAVHAIADVAERWVLRAIREQDEQAIVLEVLDATLRPVLTLMAQGIWEPAASVETGFAPHIDGIGFSFPGLKQ
jgi:hypothetical protein